MARPIRGTKWQRTSWCWYWFRTYQIKFTQSVSRPALVFACTMITDQASLSLMYPSRNQHQRWGHTLWAPGTVSTPRSPSGILRLPVVSCDTNSGLETRESLQTPSSCQTDGMFVKVTLLSSKLLKREVSLNLGPFDFGLKKCKCMYFLWLLAIWYRICII